MAGRNWRYYGEPPGSDEPYDDGSQFSGRAGGSRTGPDCRFFGASDTPGPNGGHEPSSRDGPDWRFFGATDDDDRSCSDRDDDPMQDQYRRPGFHPNDFRIDDDPLRDQYRRPGFHPNDFRIDDDPLNDHFRP